MALIATIMKNLPIASMPTARWGLTCATLNNHIYAIGGASAYDNTSEFTPVVEEYDPGSKTWAKKSNESF